jgi:hypothetical protein
VRIVDENHRDLPVYSKAGRSYVMGTVGSRYSVVIANPTPRRVEAVVSVDGLDAMDGHPANYVEKRGYIIPAYGDADIDGFRTSVDDVATFRFSSVADSYAGRLGQARDVGVIGVAFFPERAPVVARRLTPVLPYDVPPSAPGYGGARVSTEHAPAPASPPPPPAVADLDRAPAGGGGAPAKSRAADSRPGLGTEFGEARESRVEMTAFSRESPATPSQIWSVRYNNRAGLVALGIPIPPPYAVAERDLHLRETADPFRENHFALPPP